MLYPDECFDSFVCDPPYELGFMGKHWDKTGIAYNVAMWRLAFKKLKPGGYLLAFSSPRTYHRMACAIEDAGFEIRDQIAWIYGTGFAKSMSLDKAIDKQDAVQQQRARQLQFTEWMRSTGLTAAQINLLTGTNMGSHYTTAASQPTVATREHFEKLRPWFSFAVPAWVEAMVDERSVESENFKCREVVGVQKNASSGWSMGGDTKFVDRNITTAATEAAKEWSGWGTTLKPAHEPICVAWKPFKGTIAQNVLKHGTGALNIEGCAIINPGEDDRFPANLIHAGDDEVLELFPQSNGSGGSVPRVKITGYGDGIGTGKSEYLGGERIAHNAGRGSAARFFYCAKVSPNERNRGLAGLHLCEPCRYVGASPYCPTCFAAIPVAINRHPTVKPIELIRYLQRLVTRPHGLTCDLFAGSNSGGIAAKLEGFGYVGFETDPLHVLIGNAREKYA